MKKIVLFFTLASTFLTYSQGRGVKIGYIDMDYILEKVPEYAETKNQLDQKALKWKQEIEIKRNEINKLKESLKTERVLLTKELIEEREEEIAFQEKELLEYQEKRFGASGDLIVQRTMLIKPIQDQVFTAIQDISEQKKYDFIFDKSSDLTILFAAQRFDISEQVIRAIGRAQNREKLSKKQLKEQESKEALEDMEDENPELAARKNALEEKKLAREKLLEEKKAERERLIEERQKAAEEKRQKLQEERDAKKSGTVIEKDNPDAKEKEDDNKETVETVSPEDKRKQAEEEKARKAEERKKALEERRKKILEEREAAKKAKENEKKD
jgi:Skp family chaperone for outer membrane proteins